MKNNNIGKIILFGVISKYLNKKILFIKKLIKYGYIIELDGDWRLGIGDWGLGLVHNH